MDKVFIFGHRNPDTDSITSAIALEYLKKIQGIDAEARALGELNDETKFVLDYFGVKEPEYLNDVKLQLKDIDYHKDFFLNEKCSVQDTYNFLSDNNITGIPIVDDNNKFIGLVTAKTILKSIFDIKNNHIKTSYDNILKTLNGAEVLRYDDIIEGNVNAVSYKSTTFLESFKQEKDSILIVGDRHSIIESAVNNGIKLLIIAGDGMVKEEHIEIARKNKVNIISTSLDTFTIARKMSLCNFIGTLLTDERSYFVYQNEYYDEFIEKTKELGFNNYPVVNKDDVCEGLIRVTDINKKNRKKVILVDHNESKQSVIGLSEADILEVIDHHKIGDISTSTPINFRNMAVGSTNTIVYFLYNESGVMIPKHIAGLMLSGILSDTLALTSPTTTNVDKKVVETLSKICDIDYKEYSKKMFEASSNFSNKSEKEIINIDIKMFQTSKRSFKVSQVTTTNALELLDRKEKILEALELNKKDSEVDFVLFLITDIFKNGSYLLYTEGMETLLRKIYNKEIYQGVFIDGCVSRKKQVVPSIMEFEEE